MTNFIKGTNGRLLLMVVFILQLLVFAHYTNIQVLLDIKPVQDVVHFEGKHGLTYYSVKGKTIEKPEIETRASLSLVDIFLSGFNTTRRPDIVLNGRHTIMMYTSHDLLKLGRINSYMPLCEYNNCNLTTNTKKLHTSSAVVFYIQLHVHTLELPPIPRHLKNPNQPWVFLVRESQPYYDTSAWMKDEWRDMFNWSMSYRLDSDILSPYGHLKTTTSPVSKNYTDIWSKKTNMAVWIVSNCETQSMRNKFVKQLAIHGVSVDIFGKCGKNVTGDISALLSKYKFYLALENSFCEDYITEKLFSRYNEDLVVIARGGANYKELLPTNTYINALDYNTTKELAESMLTLSNDKGAYINFLKRKDKYEAEGPWPFGWMHGFCELCKRVNDVDKYRKNHKSPADFLYKPQCTKPSNGQ